MGLMRIADRDIETDSAELITDEFWPKESAPKRRRADLSKMD